MREKESHDAATEARRTAATGRQVPPTTSLDAIGRFLTSASYPQRESPIRRPWEKAPGATSPSESAAAQPDEDPQPWLWLPSETPSPRPTAPDPAPSTTDPAPARPATPAGGKPRRSLWPLWHAHRTTAAGSGGERPGAEADAPADRR